MKSYLLCIVNRFPSYGPGTLAFYLHPKIEIFLGLIGEGEVLCGAFDQATHRHGRSTSGDVLRPPIH